MSGIHTFVVRTAVKAGMYTLPSRQHFLAGIGEPGAGSVQNTASACHGLLVICRLTCSWGFPQSIANIHALASLTLAVKPAAFHGLTCCTAVSVTYEQTFRSPARHHRVFAAHEV